MLKRIGFKRALIAYSLLVALVVSGLAVATSFLLNSMNNDAKRLQNNFFTPVSALKNYLLTAGEVKSNLLSFTSEVLPGPSVARKNDESIPLLDQYKDDFLTGFTPSGEDEQIFAKGFEGAHQEFVQVIKEANKFADNHNTEDVVDILEDAWVDITINLFKPSKAQLEVLRQSYIDANTKNLDRNKFIYKANIVASSAFIFIILLSSILILKFFVRISSDISEGFNEAINTLEGSSSEIEGIALEIAQSSNQQASTLQSTSSSINQISQMIQQNSSLANSTRDLATESEERARAGIKNLNLVKEKMNELREDSQSLIEKSSDRLNSLLNIVSVINEIADKTNIINDIVSQTKLLSFNASVEAARAGEQGLGFTVVAAEVGNLATMSGEAAQQIRNMIDSSVKQVEKSVQEQTKIISESMSSNANKINQSVEDINQLSNNLEQILASFHTVRESVHKVSSSSNEQTTGVKAISEAMEELDHMASSNALTSNNLKKKSSSLIGTVHSARIVKDDYNNSIQGQTINPQKEDDQKDEVQLPQSA